MGRYEDALAAFRSGDNTQARRLSETLLTEARRSGNASDEVDGLCMLSRVALREHRLDDVKEHAEAAQQVADAQSDVRLGRMPLHMRAVAARISGDPATARRLYEQSIDLNRSLGEEAMVAAELHNLAYVELHDGNVERARELFLSARAAVIRLGSDTLAPYVVGDAAVLAAHDGDPTTAARLFGTTQEALRARGQVLDPDDQAEQDRLLHELVSRIGEETVAELARQGATVSVHEALAHL
jgi:tetratricopeptide (TPR) repeat protein